jgi:predicted nuclease of predicted toxin-antitoxin system
VKLLFDQNISYRILKQLPNPFVDSVHVTSEQLTNSTDVEIWAHAKKHDLVIVTFDADFADISTVRGHPPKVIWLRLRDTRTDNVLRVLSHNIETLRFFIEDPDGEGIACLELSD